MCGGEGYGQAACQILTVPKCTYTCTTYVRMYTCTTYVRMYTCTTYVRMYNIRVYVCTHVQHMYVHTCTVKSVHSKMHKTA